MPKYSIECKTWDDASILFRTLGEVVDGKATITQVKRRKDVVEIDLK